MTISSTVVRLCTIYLGVKGSWLDRAWFGVFPVGDSVGPDGMLAFFRGGRWEYIVSLHPRPPVHGEAPHPTGGEPVYAEHSGSKGVNLEKQSPILRCKRRAYRIHGSG